jgi:uncharacterized protein YfcZ (UPF0381/DUF406 family)
VTRKPDWQVLLHAFLMEHRYDAFRYGRCDCCLFVCDAVSVMTGVDPAAAFRGTYSSRAQARRAYGSVQELAEAVTAKHGMPESPVLHARRGDVALIKRNRDYSLGLVAMNGLDIVLASSRGLWRVPVSLAVRAWHV